MDNKNNKKEVLPIVLVVQDATEENIQRATQTLNNFFSACTYIEAFTYIVANTLVCSEKCYWLQDNYKNIEVAAKHSYCIGEHEVDIQDVLTSLHRKLLVVPHCYKPIIFFFLTSDFTKKSFYFFRMLSSVRYPKVVVNLSNSERNLLFVRHADPFAPGTKCLDGQNKAISAFEFRTILKQHLLKEEKEKKKRLMFTLTPEAKPTLTPSASPKVEVIDDYDRGFRILNHYHKPKDKIESLSENNGFINYSLVSEKSIKRNSHFTIDFITFIDEYKDIVEKVQKSYKEPSTRSGVLSSVSLDSVITLRLYSPNIPSLEDEQSFVWDGKFNITTLSGFVDKNCKGDNILLAIDVLANGIRIATVKTLIDLVKPPLGKLVLFKEDVRRVFFSYSSKDRKTALQIVKKTVDVIGNSVHFFLDALSLRAGDDWQNKIYEAIDDCDSFCLIWSYSAYRSKWVKKEWEYALNKKGLNAFNPININNEKKHHVPIPRKLSSIHFANYNILTKNEI